MPLYTRTGDSGMTSLVGGQRVAKTHVRLEAYGTIDELNSFIGLLIAELKAPFLPPSVGEELMSSGIQAAKEASPIGGGLEEAIDLLTDIQNLLFSIGSVLATDTSEHDVRPGRYIEDEDVSRLEHAIDMAEAGLPGWRGFILPGGTRAASLAHICRTVCRRAERAIYRVAAEADIDETLLRYVNRLSDYFFALAKKINHSAGQEEYFWRPREKKS